MHSLLVVGLWFLSQAGCVHRRASSFPATATTNVVEVLHGVSVADPYRWLEDDKAPATKAWIAAQNRHTFQHMAALPGRDGIHRRLTQLWNFEKFGVPFEQAGRYFVMRNDGLQNQNVLHVLDSLEANAPSRVLLDPNALAPDGTVSLVSVAVSKDARHVAYGVSKSGSDWQEWRIRELESGRDLPEVIRWVKFSETSWTPDGTGFYYCRFPEPDPNRLYQAAQYGQQLRFHRLGTDPRNDPIVYERPDQKEWRFSPKVTESGEYLIVSVRRTTSKNQLYYRSLLDPGSPMVELFTRFDATREFIDHDGSRFWIRTDADAPRGRVVEIDLGRPEKSAWKTLIPEASETLRDAKLVDGRWIGVYLKDARSEVRLFDLSGRFERQVELPGLGTVAGFPGSRKDRETFFSFASYTSPERVFRLAPAKGEIQLVREPRVAFDSQPFETRQVFYTSHDGTRIPMFLVHRRGLRLNGNHPVLLYGYGGFNIPIVPAFSVATMVWLEMGGIYAVANIRGGGEYGEAWHAAGTKHRKPNVFADFIAAAEWLCREGYTSPRRLAIEGRSNGGLLVGACLTRRPDLFRAALPAVGVLDMLRFHKFTIGWAWTADFGSPDDPEDFRTLLGYSPLHNLRRNTRYPATLMTTADHDDRVVPAHSFKFASALQAAQSGPAPILIRIDTQAGHGAGKPTSKQIDEIADKWTFLASELGLRVPPEWAKAPGKSK
ncbi:MAG: S9 family peptidase [Verrucomicrobia bacterium]|nr:S9 family peptidase [Verrucomicrobiota bacterium]